MMCEWAVCYQCSSCSAITFMFSPSWFNGVSKFLSTWSFSWHFSRRREGPHLFTQKDPNSRAHRGFLVFSFLSKCWASLRPAYKSILTNSICITSSKQATERQIIFSVGSKMLHIVLTLRTAFFCAQKKQHSRKHITTGLKTHNIICYRENLLNSFMWVIHYWK